MRSELLPDAEQRHGRHLEMMVRSDFARSPYRDIKRVSCALERNVLVLTGRVVSYYLKQVAQSLALDRVAGKLTVQNDLQVSPEESVY
jgi:hypothetical protein